MAQLRFKLHFVPNWKMLNAKQARNKRFRLTMRKRKCCMKMNRTGSRNTGCEEDYFCRLPQELVVFILNKVSDLKSLFICTLVCRHFSLLVPHVQTISVSLPPSFPEFYIPQLLGFFGNFREVESVFVEFDYSKDSHVYSPPLAMWKIKFGTNFPKVEKFVAVSPASILEPNHLYVSHQNDREYAGSRMKDCIAAYMECCDGWMHIASVLSKMHASLKRITIADSEKRGKVVFGEEQLVRLRSCAFEPVDRKTVAKSYEAFATIRVLQLPLSGLIMRNGFLLVLNYSTESSANALDEIVTWDFEDDEKVFGEAVREIHKNHRIVKIASFNR